MNHDPFGLLAADKGLEPDWDEKRKKPEQIRLAACQEREELERSVGFSMKVSEKRVGYRYS